MDKKDELALDMVHRILATDKLNMMNSHNSEYADINNIIKMLHCAYTQGYEEAERQYKHLDVHTDNTEVIANLQAEVEKLKAEKKQMMDKALRDLNEMYFLTRLCDNLQIKQELKDEAEQCNNN